MGGYGDCKFYDKLGVLVDLFCAGQITQEVFDARSLEYAEFELDCHNEWFVTHYNGAAEYLYENTEEELIRPFEELEAVAKKEIALFRKYGYDRQADDMQRMLDEAKVEA